ncbi:MAG: hypothetical protein HQL71_14495, partial [Magnetococcales bacterium]|nr:hypothetical protein [Magnetococcales bacterium]
MLPLLIPAGVSALLGVVVGRKVAKYAREDRLTKGHAKEMNKPVFIEIKREYILSDESLILATEEVPLDNRYGDQPITSEHEFIRSASITLEVDRGREIDTAVKSIFWKAFETKAADSLSKTLGSKVGSQVTRRVRLKFSVAPQKAVNYRIVWKQESRRGVMDVLVDNKKRYKIPYMVTYGLSHSVESLYSGSSINMPDNSGIIEEDV